MPVIAVSPRPVKHLNPKELVNLVDITELLHRHITESLCAKIFRQNRTVERQRKWTLHALVQFWTGVILRAPKALTQALDEARGGNKLWPVVESSSEAFFEKCKDFHWSFFARLYVEFGRRITKEAPCAYAASVAGLRRHFPEIWVMDGSQLAEVAHRLKILWKVQGAVLPGRLFVLYDIFRGISRGMVFEADAAKNENLLAKEGLKIIPEGTLVLGDRLFGLVSYFKALSEQKQWGLLRRHGNSKVRIMRTLSRKQGSRELLEDSLVSVGCGINIPKQTLRLIRYRKGKLRLDLFTNVLDVEKLSAEQAVELYGLRWSIERMFFDLKAVLNLNHFYAANPNAIAMQVFASAIVHNAFRVAQSRIAIKHGIAPELISSAKLYPKLAAASDALAQSEMMWEGTLEANPGVKLHKPEYHKRPFATTTLGAILADKRKKRHSKARCRPISVWLSWRKVRGGKKLMKKLS
jgi:hypothetical protein